MVRNHRGHRYSTIITPPLLNFSSAQTYMVQAALILNIMMFSLTSESVPPLFRFQVHFFILFKLELSSTPIPSFSNPLNPSLSKGQLLRENLLIQGALKKYLNADELLNFTRVYKIWLCKGVFLLIGKNKNTSIVFLAVSGQLTFWS